MVDTRPFLGCCIPAVAPDMGGRCKAAVIAGCSMAGHLIHYHVFPDGSASVPLAAVPLAGCWLGWQGSPSISTREVGWGRWQGKLRPRDRAPEWLGRVMSKNIGIFFFVSTSATLLKLWDNASRVRAREGLFYSFYGLWGIWVMRRPRYRDENPRMSLVTLRRLERLANFHVLLAIANDPGDRLPRSRVEHRARHAVRVATGSLPLAP